MESFQQADRGVLTINVHSQIEALYLLNLLKKKKKT